MGWLLVSIEGGVVCDGPISKFQLLCIFQVNHPINRKFFQWDWRQNYLLANRKLTIYWCNQPHLTPMI